MSTFNGIRAAALGCAIVLLSACVSRPPAGDRPISELRSAQMAVAAAEAAGAKQYAPQELNVARAKLVDAQRAADEGQMEFARRAALQAQSDADLAAARVREVQARSNLETLKGSAQ